ncbi:hypothetical protein [Lunatibacter salilacus]|uniref:hypothetical protein n=1 Tax=Lunatibacter salilacus TaxID=2483804 RepID=UPI00131E82D5|nr:hypothetical protein [Lunatibacter salilacus]
MLNYFSYLTNKDFDNWQDLMYTGGFYDKAHFFRDLCYFKAKTQNYKRALVELLGT